jgi:hypothetical protein
MAALYWISSPLFHFATTSRLLPPLLGWPQRCVVGVAAAAPQQGAEELLLLDGTTENAILDSYQAPLPAKCVH